jgi:hypothetical protein
MTKHASRAVAVLAGVVGAGSAMAQTSATINSTGMELRCQLFGPCFPNQSRNSSANPSPAGPAQFVNPASGYSYDIQGTVTTTGIIGSIIPSGSTIAQMLDTLRPGASKLTRGWVRNPEGTIPTNIYSQRFDGTFAGLTVGVTLVVRVTATGTAFFEITNITIPLGSLAGTLRINAGTTNVTVWNPSPQQASEWHFNGGFTPVSGSPGKLRYLDDPAFGTVLGGIGNENTPNPAAPTGVTAAQSAFGTTTSFGIPGPGGVEDTVYRTSPARNLSNTNPDLRRGVGLVVAPFTKPVFPGDTIGQWTMVWDVYIPTAAWAAEYPVALLEDSDNNDSAADLMIRRDPSRGPTIGYGVIPEQYVAAPQIQPNTWLRIAVVNDHPRLNTATFYVNGTPVGSTAGDWLYNYCDPSAPTYGDGTAVAGADWAAWGQFPNPWRVSPNPSNPAPINTTFSMFSDLEGGRSESVYLANYLFLDRAMTPAEVGALGGSNAAGILFPELPPPACAWQIQGCPADYDNSGGIDGDDVIAFFGEWDAGAECADADESGGIDGDDVIVFFGLWDAGGC